MTFETGDRMAENDFLTKCAAKLLQSENDGEIMLYVYTV